MNLSLGLRDQLTRHLEHALNYGLPPFATPELHATPMNSTPYVCSLSQLKEVFSKCRRRRALVETLCSALDDVRSSYITPRALLIGGSVNDVAVAYPNDLDVVVFYEADDLGPNVRMLDSIRETLHLDGVDTRFFPIDVNPILLMKFVSFFSVLFSKGGHESAPLTRGLLLVDLSIGQSF